MNGQNIPNVPIPLMGMPLQRLKLHMPVMRGFKFLPLLRL